VDLAQLTERRRKEIATLPRRRGRDRLGQFLLEGMRSIQAAVDAAAPLVDAVVSESARTKPEVIRLLDRLACTVYGAPDRVVDRLADVQASQGILAVAERPGAPGPDHSGARRLLLLDGVQDPGNVGTLLRTAAWFGVDRVVSGPGTADFYGPKVVRSAMGALWDLVLDESDDIAALVVRLRAEGVEAWGADMTGVPLGEWAPTGRVALVVGAEAAGLSPAVRKACAGTVTIPPAGPLRGTESLNVAAAAAVLMARLGAA